MINLRTLILSAATMLAFQIAEAQTRSTQDTINNKGRKSGIDNPSKPALPDSIRKQTVPKTQQDSAYKRKRDTDPAIYPADSTQMK